MDCSRKLFNVFANLAICNVVNHPYDRNDRTIVDFSFIRRDDNPSPTSVIARQIATVGDYAFTGHSGQRQIEIASPIGETGSIGLRLTIVIRDEVHHNIQRTVNIVLRQTATVVNPTISASRLKRERRKLGNRSIRLLAKRICSIAIGNREKPLSNISSHAGDINFAIKNFDSIKFSSRTERRFQRLILGITDTCDIIDDRTVGIKPLIATKIIGNVRISGERAARNREFFRYSGLQLALNIAASDGNRARSRIVDCRNLRRNRSDLTTFESERTVVLNSDNTACRRITAGDATGGTSNVEAAVVNGNGCFSGGYCNKSLIHNRKVPVVDDSVISSTYGHNTTSQIERNRRASGNNNSRSERNVLEQMNDCTIGGINCILERGIFRFTDLCSTLSGGNGTVFCYILPVSDGNKRISIGTERDRKRIRVNVARRGKKYINSCIGCNGDIGKTMRGATGKIESRTIAQYDIFDGGRRRSEFNRASDRLAIAVNRQLCIVRCKGLN